jgi:hypothetical protein
MRRFARALSLAALAVLTGCHLSDSADPVTCESGQHPNNGHCVLDAVSAVTVTISPGEGGAACTVSPDSITVAANAEFELKNDDDVEHVVTGADGLAWATVKAHQLSPLIGITKAGSWAYTVSGCSKGGTVVVQ